MTLEQSIKVAPLLSFGVALISAVVALIVFRHTRHSNRRRATLDMVMRSLHDQDARQIHAEFRSLLTKERDADDCFKIASLMDETPENKEDRNRVISQLNIYELIALGINNGVFDEQFYKRWFHGQFTKDFEGATPLINAIRENRPSVYCEYQALYARWIRKRHPVSHPGRLKMAWWTFRKQDAKVDAVRRAMEA